MCEWEAPPPQMHRVFLHLLFLSVVFFERCIGRLCICVFFVSFFVGRAQRLPARCIGCLCMCCFFCYFLSSSGVFSSWCSWKQCGSERRQPFKKRLEGGWGGGRGASPPQCMGRLCMCCFFSVIFVFFFLCFFFVMFLEALWQWEEATFEKKGTFKKKAGGGALGVFACVVFLLVNFCLLLVFFLRDVLGSNVAVRGGNLLVSTFFFLRRCRLARDFLYQFPRTLAALAGGWGPVANTGRIWSRLTSRELYQHRPQIAQANSCVITMWRKMERRMVYHSGQFFLAMAPSNGFLAMASSNGT